MTLSFELTGLLIIAILASLILLVRRWQPQRHHGIPWARGGIPLLGHALAYKHDAPGFLRKQSKEVGAAFRINLAGKCMVVLGLDPDMHRRVAMASENQLSARKAVAAVGFVETLGADNVFHGTDFHKRVIKENPIRNDTHYVSTIYTALSCFPPGDVEFLGLVRRCVLRAVIDDMLGASLLQADPGFVEAFVRFQDHVEDATAKAAVLPRPIALVLHLWPVALRRMLLTRRLRSTILLGDGPWARAYRERAIDANLAATFTLGLLFAGYKNPAIAASQATLFLLDNLSARAEATAVVQQGCSLAQCSAIRNGSLETLRLTAHSIGAIREVCVDEFQLTDHCKVAKGDTIAVTHIVPNTDPNVWGPDALKFNPDRWENVRPSVGNSLATFSQGLHMCPGRHHALAMVHAAVAVFLHEFDRGRLQLAAPVPPLCFERATLAQRAGPVKVTLKAHCT